MTRSSCTPTRDFGRSRARMIFTRSGMAGRNGTLTSVSRGCVICMLSLKDEVREKWLYSNAARFLGVAA